MNFNPQLSTGAAMLMSLLAAFLWGTWAISLKYLKDYPLDGFFMDLYTTSLLFVWVLGFSLDGGALIGNIAHVFAADPARIGVTIACGVLYVIGLRISLEVLKMIGLALSQPIQSSIYILFGTFVSGWIGGVPESASIPRIVLACLFLFAAVMVTMLAGKIRSKVQAVPGQSPSGLQYDMATMWKAVGLLLVSAIFSPAYTLGLSYGLRSVTHPEGLSVMPFMALLATGAFLGALMTSGFTLTRTRQWMSVFRAPLPIHAFGIVSGLFHYGGNVIHTFATSFLSSVISWPLGTTMGLWTELWGIAYGEFRGSPRKVYAALFLGIALYLVGGYLLATSM